MDAGRPNVGFELDICRLGQIVRSRDMYAKES